MNYPSYQNIFISSMNSHSNDLLRDPSLQIQETSRILSDLQLKLNRFIRKNQDSRLKSRFQHHPDLQLNIKRSSSENQFEQLLSSKKRELKRDVSNKPLQSKEQEELTRLKRQHASLSKQLNDLQQNFSLLVQRKAREQIQLLRPEQDRKLLQLKTKKQTLLKIRCQLLNQLNQA